MTIKERAALYEAAAICVAGFFGAFAVPELLNAHDSIAALAAVVLLAGWACWLGYFTYRMRGIK